MSYNLKNRSFLKEIDFEPAELRYLLKLAESLKLAKYAGTEVARLPGKEIALIFEKTSTRTRSAFEVAAYDQGGHVTYLDPSGSQLGHKESIADTASVLGRMYDAIESPAAPQPNWRNSPRTPACPSTTGSPPNGIPPRCSPTSSPCTRPATSRTTGWPTPSSATAASTWAAPCWSWAR